MKYKICSICGSNDWKIVTPKDLSYLVPWIECEDCGYNENYGREITSCGFMPKSKTNEECPDIQKCYNAYLESLGE